MRRSSKNAACLQQILFLINVIYWKRMLFGDYAVSDETMAKARYIIEKKCEVSAISTSNFLLRYEKLCQNNTQQLRRLFKSSSHSELIGYNTAHTG
jgi:hypothetical protein